MSIARQAAVRMKGSGNGMRDTCGWRRAPVKRPPSFAISFRPTSGMPLPFIHCPTLVLNRRGYRLVTTDHARYLAEHIPDARLVELPGRTRSL